MWGWKAKLWKGRRQVPEAFIDSNVHFVCEWYQGEDTSLNGHRMYCTYTVVVIEVYPARRRPPRGFLEAGGLKRREWPGRLVPGRPRGNGVSRTAT